jgi:GNAT superfamily N-acetyltransferase
MERPAFTMRNAAARDAAFLELMVLAAATWSSDRQLDLDQLRREPDLIHYVAGWPQDSDIGVIAEDPDSNPVGAVWLRYFSEDDPGYGYVRADVPELSIGVLDVWRRRGVGRALIRSVASRARRRGATMLSLSVERANPAAQLYLSEGWRVVENGRDSDTMVLELDS